MDLMFYEINYLILDCQYAHKPDKYVMLHDQYIM